MSGVPGLRSCARLPRGSKGQRCSLIDSADRRGAGAPTISSRPARMRFVRSAITSERGRAPHVDMFRGAEGRRSRERRGGQGSPRRAQARARASRVPVGVESSQSHNWDMVLVANRDVAGLESSSRTGDERASPRRGRGHREITARVQSRSEPMAVIDIHTTHHRRFVRAIGNGANGTLDADGASCTSRSFDPARTLRRWIRWGDVQCSRSTRSSSTTARRTSPPRRRRCNEELSEMMRASGSLHGPRRVPPGGPARRREGDAMGEMGFKGITIGDTSPE